MSRKGLFALAVVLFAGGTLLLLSASYLRRRADSIRLATVAVKLDESWRGQELLKDYKLAERSGRLFDSHELDGQVHVVSFFFTSCPGPCFRMNGQVQVLHEAYRERGVKFVSITCDPELDSPRVLAEYARKFQADDKSWFFLTGDFDHLKRVSTEVYLLPLDKALHSEKLLVVDRWGKIRGKFHWNNPEQLAEMRLLLDQLLDERKPPPEEPPKTVPPPADDDAEIPPAESPGS